MNKLAPRKAMWGAPGQILRPVVGLDIDGTCGEYHEHFAEYAEGFLQRVVLRHWDGTMPYWKCFGVSKTRYREMKLGYRQGRLKRSMPVIPGGPELAHAVRAAGAELWVCTTRPWLRLDNIDPDTRFWLRNNRIPYDGVLFGETKYKDLASLVGIERVVAVLDDDSAQLQVAERYGLPGYLIDRPYNQEAEGSRLESLDVAAKVIIDNIKDWLKERGVK